MDLILRHAHKVAFSMMIVGLLILFWMIGALGVIGDEGDHIDILYSAVFATALIGSLISRFRSAGMARTAAVMAIAQALIMVMVLLAGLVPSYNSVFEIIGLNAFFIAVFTGAALLFRHARIHETGLRSDLSLSERI